MFSLKAYLRIFKVFKANKIVCLEDFSSRQDLVLKYFLAPNNHGTL